MDFISKVLKPQNPKTPWEFEFDWEVEEKEISENEFCSARKIEALRGSRTRKDKEQDACAIK